MVPAILKMNYTELMENSHVLPTTRPGAISIEIFED